MSIATASDGGRVAPGAGWQPLFWNAFKRSKNAMALLDERRCHVEVNGAYLRLFGYSREELIGRPVYDFLIGGSTMSTETWRAHLKEPQFTGILDARRRDGGRVTVEYAGYPTVVNGRSLVLGVVLRADRRGRRLDRLPPDSAAGKLSKRELDVVMMIALGATGPEIADELHVSHNTVRTHARNAMTKTGARSRAHLVAKALAEILQRQEAG